MKKYIKISLLVILFSFKNYGQLSDTFEKSNIELVNGKKEQGLIKLGDKEEMANNIIFFKNGNQSAIFYSPSEVNRVVLNNGEIYVTLKIKINRNKKEIDVFAKQLIEGKASLYKSTYNSSDFFIIINKGISYVLQNDKIDNNEFVSFNYEGYFKLALEDIYPSEKKITFSESNFIKLVSEYNKLNGGISKIIEYKNKPIHYFIGFVGLGIPNKFGAKEFFIQSTYRTYFPRFSKNTALNIGLNYYNYQYSEEYVNFWNSGISKFNYKTNLISAPIQIQKNILNKKIRPFISLGLNLSYIKNEDQFGNSQIDKGFQNSFGIGLAYGLGVEYDVYKNIMLKGEFKNEIFSHLLLVGIGYNFSK
jgi:hypothetical protein